MRHAQCCGKVGGALVAGRRFFRQCLEDDRFQRHRQLGIECARGWQRLVGLFHEKAIGRVGGIGCATSHHFIENNAQAINVGAGVTRFTACRFGTHIVGRADQGAGHGHLLLFIEQAGNAKIGEQRVVVALIAKENVARFDVAMDHAPLVGIGQGVGQL